MKWLVLWYLLASVVAFAIFAIDKGRARQGRRRTPERTLHIVAFAGGFAGAFAAMIGLRHKNRKASFWMINIAALVAHATVLSLLAW